MNGSVNGAMGGNPAMASHLAELDARYESHLAAVRDRAEHAREVVRNANAALSASVRKPLDLASVPVDEQAYMPRSGGSRQSFYDNTTIIPNSAILPDSPLGGGSSYSGSPPPSLEEINLDDDGIPLWQD
jgi:hypothetical protein